MVATLKRLPEAKEEPFSLEDLLRVLSFRRRLVAGVCIGFAIMALVVRAWQTPEYFAESQLEINSASMAAMDLGNEPMAGAENEYVVTLATQASVLGSDTLALQVIHQLNLESLERQRFRFDFLPRSADDALPLEQSPQRQAQLLKSFHSHLSVKVLGGTRIVQVGYQDRDPVLAAAVVNTLVNDYLEQYFQSRYTATRQASDWLSAELASLKQDMEASQQRLVDYQRQTGILGESETNNVVMAKLEELNKQLSAAQANRVVKQAVWELARTGDPELISSLAGSSFVQGVSSNSNFGQLGLLPTLRSQEAQLKAEIAQNSARLGPAFPKSIQLQKQLHDLQDSIETEIRKVTERARNDYTAASHAEEMERALFEKQKQEANALNSSAIQYGILKREVDASRDLYQGLLGKLKQASVLAGLRSSNIIVIDQARPPFKPTTPGYAFSVVCGATLGLLVGPAVALFRDALDKTMHTPRDVSRLIGVQPIAVIPRFEKDGESFAEAGERFRSLRTSLLLDQTARSKVIAITSALPGEGKSTVSIQLARVLAKAGGRVLLVDGDLRRPTVHHEFGERTNGEGLGAALSGQLTDGADIQDVGNGLYVLTAGAPLSFPVDLLHSPRMAALLTSWREHFDHIVLDTPPLLQASDAILLARAADILLLVVRADKTRADAVLRALEVLEQGQNCNIRTVFNAMDFRGAGYVQYYGHAYTTTSERAS